MIRPMTAAAPVTARFLEMVAAHGESVAVIDREAIITYAELSAAAHRIADAIEAGPGGLVGLRMQRSWHAIAAMVGATLAGRAYVPVDPGYPQERQRHILTDSALEQVIDDGPDGWQMTRLPAGGARPVPPGAMYVIYTSGSTGSPKGVVIEQRNVAALLASTAGLLGARPGRRWSVFHSFSFDVSVWEIWGALLEGSAAVIVDRASAQDPVLLADLLRREHVDVLSLVPSAFTFLVRSLTRWPKDLPDLRYIVFGGEAIRPPDVAAWWRCQAAPGARLVNMYGITETTVHVTYCVLTPELLASAAPGRTPIGRPLPHLRVDLTPDGGRSWCQAGEPGEIAVSGSGVGSGYLGRDELTAERFPELDGERRYLSGDWAVRQPDGSLLYLGRRDDQVKIRGHRIELGEVEALLAQHPEVIEAACAVERRPGQADRLIACVVTPRSSVAGELRGWLAGRAPAHVVPSVIVAVDRLPTAASGKVARQQLPELAAAAQAAS